MGQKASQPRAARAALSALATAILALLLTTPAQAAPFHPRTEALDVTGLNHACGVAVDSKGDLYASSAGESKIKVYDPSHTLLTEISNANTPCGLAVTTTGDLYVSERATGNVVRYKPNAYPFAGTPTYGAAEPVDSSGKAKGIAVDRFDNRLYVAAGDHIAVYKSDGNLEEIDEVQKVSVSDATGGSFKLKFKGQETAAIKFDASAAEVKSALEALSTIGAGNVSVSATYVVAFTSTLAHTDVETLGSDFSGLEGTEAKVTVTETTKGFNGHVGEGTLTEASGVAAYTYPGTGNDRYLWVADASGLAADRLYLFAGSPLSLRRELTGATTPDGSFGFGPAGAYLAADPGNRNSESKCVAVGEQACTAGHLFLYDAAHKALDEFDASGEYLDRTANASFADAEPTAIAIDRSGAANDGTVYVTAGAGAGAKALAFGPLKAPSREALEEPLSHELEGARAVAVDSHGDVYAGAGSEIHVYDPEGNELTSFEDEHNARDIAVDSAGNVYVLDINGGILTEAEVTYYAPSSYPPEAGTTYSRHEPPIVLNDPETTDFPPNNPLKAIAVDPGPGSGKDRLFLTSGNVTHVYDTAANGSALLDPEFGKCVKGIRQSVAVNGANGTAYIAVNTNGIYAVSKTGEECLARFDAKGSPNAKTNANPLMGINPLLAVDQANGHVLAFDGRTSGVREYDAAGSFVAEYGSFTEGATRPYRIAVDSSCAIHEPPLDETTTPTCNEYDPANRNAYVAFDDPSSSHPPYDVSAFGPLEYPAAPKHKLTVKKTGKGSGKVTSEPSEPAGIDCGATCSAEFEETKVVTLTATPDPKMEFTGWSGCEAEPSPTKCEVTLSEDKGVTAAFEPEPGGTDFQLTVSPEGPGTGKVTSSPEGIDCPSTCAEKFSEGVKVVLKAKADKGFEFTGWSGCDAEPTPTECEVTMSEDKEVEAEFDIEHPLLTAVKEGTGAGTVTSEEPGIDCGSTCSAKFDLNESVTLTAKAAPSSEFTGWGEGDCEAETVSSTEGTCEVTMSEPKQVAVSFLGLPQAIANPALPVSYTEATLRGEVDTAELASEYHFEYLTQGQYEENGETFQGAQSTPTLKLAAAKGFTPVQAALTGLEEGTEYRFRLLVENALGTLEDEESFQTLQHSASSSCANAAYRFGLSANLPDCRAYELVTPAQTNGVIPYAANDGGTPSGLFNNWLTVPRGEAAGERLSYFADGTLPGFGGNGRLDGYRAERGAGDHPVGGWQSALFSPDYAESAPGTKFSLSQHGVASDQLYSFWESTPEPEAFPQTLPQGLYLRTPAGFEALGQGSLGTDLGVLSRYVSAGGAHAIFTSTEHLEEEAAPTGTVAIYDRAAGETSAEVVSIRPDGTAFGAGEGATYLGAAEDGAAVAFRVGGTLYLHREGSTVEIAEAPNTFAGISSDGQRVFYAATATGNSPAPLYACDTETGPCAGSGAHSPDEIAAAGIFTEVSSGGSRAFFSSTEALTGGEENDNGEEAQPGEHNLYAWDGAETRFVGGLSVADFKQNAFAGISEMNLAAWTRAIGLTPGSQSGRSLAPTRSTPDGDVFVFQSHARLTEYDNEGKGEIYRYDPAADAGERLLCVSCDPSGAPPSADALFQDVRGFPGNPIQTSTMIPNLTDSGEAVVFQSFDRLLPEDANEVEDVYEWRARGTGGCTRSRGCLALISSGQGETASILYAMSADGRDVFFHTKEKLVGADVAGSPSIYDAREGGGIPEPTPPAPCQGDACQGQGSGAPALPGSATGGAGEASEAPKARRCGKGRHRVKGRCVKRHAKKHHRRAKHDRRAHR